MNMLAGGALLAVAGLVTGEAGHVHLSQVSTESLLAFAYLVAIGSIVAFSAFHWLLKNAPISIVTTYAYVNPVVAVLLGAAFLGEPLTLRTLLARVAIVVSVVLIVGGPTRVGGRPPEYAPDVARAGARGARAAPPPALREKLLAPPACAALCPFCGRDLNDEPHTHEEELPAPRGGGRAELRDRL